MKFPYLLNVTFWAAVFLLAGCSAGSLVKETDYAASPDISESDAPTPIRFSGLNVLLPPGVELGNVRSGVFCESQATPVNRNELKKHIDTQFLRSNFYDAMVASGYDVTGAPDLVFDPDDEEQRAEYSIAGTLKDVRLDMCEHGGSVGDWLTGKAGENGKMSVAIDWSVYDRLRRHVVYKVRTEGYSERRIPNSEGMSLLFHDAFDMAVHNLGADAAFRDLIVDGVKPDLSALGRDERGGTLDMRPRVFDTQEVVVIPPKTLSKQLFTKNAEDKANVAVMLQKGGSGAGFFITKQGHILSNAHVVGEARTMRVVMAGHKGALMAEVLRVDKTRDVALLKLVECPEGLLITTAPIRTQWPLVGEDIYAVGTSLDGKIMRPSVTKGIVSAQRKMMKYEGVRMSFIQGDVDVNPSSSGGPLLDEHGRIIGMSVLSKAHGNENTASVGIGLNLFIPIKEALDVLDIDY